MNKLLLLLGLFALFVAPKISYGQHNITIDRFIGYTQASGIRGTVTAGGSNGLTIERTGTAVKFGAILRRPDTSNDVAGIGLYIGAAPAINSVAGNSSATANGDGYTVGTGLGAAAGGADWNIDPANIRTYLLDLTSTYPSSYSFTISGSTPGTGGAVAGSQRNIYLAAYDVFTHVIFAVSQPIVLNFVDTPPSTFQPVITNLNTSSGYDGTLVTITGTGFDYTRHVYLGGLEMPFFSASSTVITAQVPTNALSGPIRVQVSGGAISNGVPFTVLRPTSPPIITHVDNVSNGLYYPDPQPVVLRPNEQLRIFSSQNRTGIALSSYNIVAIDFNGVRTTNFFLNTGQGSFAAYDLYVVVPPGITPGNITLVTAALGSSNGLPYRFPRPQSACGDVICSDQYVPYGTAPSPLLGRILAWGSSGLIDYNNPSPADIDYLEYRRYFSSQIFAELTEFEAVQWQLSYTNNGSDWQDISGANGRDYQPSWCFRKTYYRRVSTHQLRHWWGGQFTDHWYDSNTITITPYLPVSDGLYNIYNRNTGQVLEIGGSTPLVAGTRANQWPSVGTANQQWMVTSTGYGVHKIINRNSGQALEIGGGATLSPGAGANQWPYWGGNNQQWRLVTLDSAPNYVRVVNVNSGQVLEIGGGAPTNTNWGAQANQWPPYAGDYSYEQHWQLVPVAPPTASARFPGVYSIRNVGSGKVLEVSNGGTNNGDVVQQWDNADLGSQQWIFEDAGSGLFNIKNRNSGKSLDVYVAGQNNGDLVQQWQYGAGSHQQWEVVEVRPGVFRITGYHTILAGAPKSLDIDANRINQNGVQVQQWQYGGASNQEWNISYVSYNRGTQPGKDVITQPSISPRRPAPATANLLLYPNPASTVLTVTLSDATPLQAVTIRDLRGAVVVNRQTLDNGRVDVSALAAGTYLITVSDGVREYHQKFTKQ